MRAGSFIRHIYAKFPGLLIASTALWLLVGVFEAASIVSVVPVVDLFVQPSLEDAGVLTLRIVEVMRSVGLPVGFISALCLLFVFNLIKSLFQTGAQYVLIRTKFAVLRDLLVGSFDDFLRARWHFFTSSCQGTLLNTFIREITLVGDAFGAMSLFFSNILLVLLYLTVPFWLSWQVTLVSMAVAIVLVLPFMLLGRVAYRLGHTATVTANDMSSIIKEALGSAKTILGFGNQSTSVDRLARSFEMHRRAGEQVSILRVGIPILYFPMGLIVVAVALVSAKHFRVPLSELAALLYSLFRIVPCVGQIAAQKTSLDNYFPSYEQVLRLRSEAQRWRQKDGGRRFDGFRKEIRLAGLSFAYPDHEPVLREIDLTIPRGRMVAFVGASGAGKSTLADIILGLHIPTGGQITIDGVPLSELDVVSYRRRIGYVPQDSALFDMSIRDNLLWAKPDATEEEILEACRRANAADFIEDFPKGFDTVVGDRGVRLSGGQVQRIALARAIIRRPELLILDEATSSLDSKAERLIQDAIDKIAKETTVIVVAHRLSTISNADRIYVMDRGRIVEDGSYRDLIAKKGKFARMAELQELETTKG